MVIKTRAKKTKSIYFHTYKSVVWGKKNNKKQYNTLYYHNYYNYVFDLAINKQ
jgi:hypothetical protein